jgi:hypothetical protein
MWYSSQGKYYKPLTIKSIILSVKFYYLKKNLTLDEIILTCFNPTREILRKSIEKLSLSMIEMQYNLGN